MRSGQRRLRELRAADFEACPVWQYARNTSRQPGDIEQRVKPRRDVREIRNHEALEDRLRHVGLLVRAAFRARDGSRYDGFCTPEMASASDPDPTDPAAVRLDAFSVFSMEPWILTRRGPLPLWRWDKPFAPKEAEALYTALGTTGKRLFPLRFECAVAVVPPLAGAGVLPGMVAWVQRLGVSA